MDFVSIIVDQYVITLESRIISLIDLLIPLLTCIYMAISRNEFDHFPQKADVKQWLSRYKYDVRDQIVKVCGPLKTYGVHSSNRMRTAGFAYIGDGDKARCDACGFEASGWVRDVDPFCIHLESKPDCLFVRSVLAKSRSVQSHEENPAKRQKTELSLNPCTQQNKLIELDILTEVRKRTFSHWPRQVTPTREQMIAAGFFHCNVGDRVICLYCNLICQQWKGETDDPIEVHKTLSEKCPFVLSILLQQGSSSVMIVNELSTSNNSDPAVLLNNTNQFRFDQIVYTSACHIAYTSIPSRQATFETWTHQSAPPVDDLVKAGFFYTGAKNIVTCFYCNGSLQNWGENDNPLIEHIRWFPHCAYAKQLSGTELYNKVQEAKRIRQG
jgi:hypothetical protein